MANIERWECQSCGMVDDLPPGQSHGRRNGRDRCHGPVVKVEYVRADLHQGAVEALGEIKTVLVEALESEPPVIAKRTLRALLQSVNRALGGR